MYCVVKYGPCLMHVVWSVRKPAARCEDEEPELLPAFNHDLLCQLQNINGLAGTTGVSMIATAHEV